MTHTSATDDRILVAGGGIGGLATALSLSRAGRHVVVLERASELQEFGAGIQLAPNAFHALHRLGIDRRALDQAIFVDRLRLMDAMTADEVISVDLGTTFRQRFGYPYAVIHRGDLHNVLIDACREASGIDIRTDSNVLGYKETGGDVLVRLDGGAVVRGTALIGADGIWSRVRRAMLGDAPPRVPGHTTFRSVIPIEAMPEELRWNDAVLWAGDKCHIVHYPLSDYQLFNFAITAHNGAMEAVSGAPASQDEVERTFAHVHDTVRSIIRHGRDWKRWVLCDRDPTHLWVDGRVALLGDAAHPTLQYLAQGACMALEDAVCLGDAMRFFGDDVEAALLAYRDLRVPRAAEIVLRSRGMGEHVYHPSGRRAALRDEILRAQSSVDLHEKVAWLYEGGRESEHVFARNPHGFRSKNAINPAEKSVLEMSTIDDAPQSAAKAKQ
ncbi:3-hydroxybenzoate 6-monooxygenase [uncultured Roseobacter sp.]|uniref:3-hydroxybenzoate 6-monooxygenase n=1 Tax=uncultured Roseobacter sp. TaxID=114847 RepID=UPI002605268E|nr:3-hydroxybenzoate 6-monooxygenase [uncultured Roseobacter sp.]